RGLKLMGIQPELFVIGGPNGSGKTTLALQYSKLAGLPYLSADFIAEQLAPGNPLAAAIRAGRLLSKQLAEAITRRESPVLESTLAGLWLGQPIQGAISAGYRITVIYVFLSAPGACSARIRERVAKGGHDVPPADVQRRFNRSLHNFWNVYRGMAAEWMLFY